MILVHGMGGIIYLLSPDRTCGAIDVVLSPYHYFPFLQIVFQKVIDERFGDKPTLTYAYSIIRVQSHAWRGASKPVHEHIHFLN